MQTFGEGLTPWARETISTTTASIGFTASYLSHSTYGYLPMRAAEITAEKGAIRFTTSGATPTVGDVGDLILENATHTILGIDACRKFRCINESASSGAILNCRYFY